jgi:hypothetical protein
VCVCVCACWGLRKEETGLVLGYLYDCTDTAEERQL